MFERLLRTLPATGEVLFAGALAPPEPQFLELMPAGLRVTRVAACDDAFWDLHVEHPEWGRARIAAPRRSFPMEPVAVEFAPSLSDAEKRAALTGQSRVRIDIAGSRGNVLRDRKHLLRWLHLVMSLGGVVAFDAESFLFWSQAMLDDELAHDAELDVEALYALHAVTTAGGDGVSWLHTHGLERVGAFDVDILSPSARLLANISDPVRALACAALEGTANPGDPRYLLADPGGEVRLVPVAEFNRQASPAHRALRDDDEAHSGRRVVLCEPVGGLLARWRQSPVPSTFLSTVDDDRFLFQFSDRATALMADRARQTVSVLQRLTEEFAEFELPAHVKLGYEGDSGGHEHLWFQCHRASEDQIDATLVSVPFEIAGLKAGDRAVHPIERLSDWTIHSPAGVMTPRNISAARLLRERADELRRQMRES